METYVSNDPELEDDADSTHNVFIPQVQIDIIPVIGQEFPSLADVFSFYNNYAKASGFSVRSNTQRKCSGTIIRKEYTCSKVDPPVRLLSVDSQRKRGSIGENCKAMISVLFKSGVYVVSLFREEHSHPLSCENESHLLNSHRKVDVVAKSLKKQMDVVNIPTSKQFALLQIQRGGAQNLGFIRRDFYNYNRDVNADLKGHDGDRLYDYMKLRKDKDSAFTFKIECDDEKKIRRCFWCDGYSKRVYGIFGDVIVFDTTYQTNRYGLIFAPIVGVNNHGQTIILACGFLNHETTEDFVWFFSLFLEAMSNRAPFMVITDQDPAMIRALPTVMPNTIHRYCSWHIMYKFSSKLDVRKYTTYSEVLHDCILRSESPEEFEKKWKDVMDLSGLGDNEWLQELYDIREKWVPAYTNGTFSAGMTSSQRAESGHAFFKRFVSANNSLVDFMIRFECGLAQQRHEELVLNNKDKVEKPRIQLPHRFLFQMSDIYTLHIYRKFEQQFAYSLDYKLDCEIDDCSKCVYKIQKKFAGDNDEGVDARIRYITKDKLKDMVSCSCRKFESEGIICRHILAFFGRFEDFHRIPDKYIIKRWIKSEKSGISDSESTSNDAPLLAIRSKMVRSVFEVIDKAVSHEETRNMFDVCIRSLSESIDTFIANRKRNNSENSAAAQNYSVQSGCTVESTYIEPDAVRYKGCGKRLKSSKELSVNGRHCNGCNLDNQTHDKRTCLVRKAIEAEKLKMIEQEKMKLIEQGKLKVAAKQ